MTSFTSNTLFQETEDRKTMDAECQCFDIIDRPCAVNDKGLGRITPGATCGRASVYLVVSDSSLALISGGKRRTARERTLPRT